MKILILTLTLFIFCLFPVRALVAQDNFYLNTNTPENNSIDLTGRIYLKNEVNNKKSVIEDKITSSSIKENLPVNSNLLAEEYSENGKFSSLDENFQIIKKKKSLPLGILLSALVPGAGEFYAGSYLKAGIFFAVELLAWSTYFYFDAKGNNKTDDYQKFADENWNVRQYAQWLIDQNFTESGGINPNEQNLEILREQINVCERVNFSHTLLEYGSQQYYELIGKYQNFMSGWKDARTEGGTWLVTGTNYFTYHTAMFNSYSVDRQDANDFYDYAKIGPITAILNHILSAADAAWEISTYNQNIRIRTGFRIDNKVSPYTYKIKQVPTFNLSVNF